MYLINLYGVFLLLLATFKGFRHYARLILSCLVGLDSEIQHQTSL